MVLVLFVMSIVIFAAMRLLPGDWATIMMGLEGSEEGAERIRSEAGLDRPIYVQYAAWFWNTLQGNLGVSSFSKQPVIDLVRAKLPATLMLALAGTLFGLLVSFPLGIISGIKPYSWADNVTTLLSLLGVAVPPFWLGMMLMLLFADRIPILPAAGYVKPSVDLGLSLKHLVLPTLTIGLQLAASQTRFLRSGMLDVMSMDYVRTARAKGLPERIVVVRHCLKNALLTVVTVFSLNFGALLSGAIVTEAVFFWPGLGTLLVSAIGQRDYAVVQAIVLFMAAMYVAVNLLADLSYAYLDPRIRYESGS
jgi:peptide/nickel transport system permease protein